MMLCAFFFVSFGGGEANAQSLTTPFPSTFRNTRANELIDGATLAPVFRKIHERKTVKVMQIGMNGAWARRFYEQDMINRVVAERPDLLIVSFGTNEAHGSTLDERVHAETMRTLTQRISEQCPGVCFLFTTPPGSYISQRTGSYTTGTGRRRRTHYSTTKVPNQNTANVARSIVNFCHSHHMAVWDIFTIAGGATSACTNWRNAGLMNTDCIHYVAAGYTLQGKLLGEAIYKAYTGTATSGSQTRMMHGSTPKEQKPYKTVKGF